MLELICLMIVYVLLFASKQCAEDIMFLAFSGFMFLLIIDWILNRIESILAQFQNKKVEWVGYSNGKIIGCFSVKAKKITKNRKGKKIKMMKKKKPKPTMKQKNNLKLKKKLKKKIFLQTILKYLFIFLGIFYVKNNLWIYIFNLQ